MTVKRPFRDFALLLLKCRSLAPNS